MTSFKTILAVFGLFVLAACEVPDAHSDGGAMQNGGEVMGGGEVMLGG